MSTMHSFRLNLLLLSILDHMQSFMAIPNMIFQIVSGQICNIKGQVLSNSWTHQTLSIPIQPSSIQSNLYQPTMQFTVIAFIAALVVSVTAAPGMFTPSDFCHDTEECFEGFKCITKPGETMGFCRYVTNA
ncbi:hypothetical protein O5D80_004603 [Batrachochytrium dendrobatidis]|nr:hypothetical protein O5D80_004603 [Batrachochytrium dendrobatidis]